MPCTCVMFLSDALEILGLRSPVLWLEPDLNNLYLSIIYAYLTTFRLGGSSHKIGDL